MHGNMAKLNDQMEDLRKVLGDVHGFTTTSEFTLHNILKEVVPAPSQTATTDEVTRCVHTCFQSMYHFYYNLCFISLFIVILSLIPS